MDLKKKTIIWEENTEPPRNYIWVKSDNKAYEYNNITRKWEESEMFSSGTECEEDTFPYEYISIPDFTIEISGTDWKNDPNDAAKKSYSIDLDPISSEDLSNNIIVIGKCNDNNVDAYDRGQGHWSYENVSKYSMFTFEWDVDVVITFSSQSMHVDVSLDNIPQNVQNMSQSASIILYTKLDFKDLVIIKEK